jgi:imidazoleglycerol-phosphate dehydratase
MKTRSASLRRTTRETDIAVTLRIEGSGKSKISTGMPFLDHMLDLLARHSLFDLDVRATGDLAVDYHHTVEDLGLVLGDALHRALGDRKGITRYGHALLPMDESLSLVAVDLGGRPFLVYEIANRKKKILDFDLGLVEEFMRAFCTQARMNLHIVHLYGQEPHHAYESVFKGLARALSTACRKDPRERGVPSSKGIL